MNINIKGIDVNYVRQGSGQTILMLHGWGTSVEPFAGIMNLVSDKYEAVALDFPGFGQTPEPPEPWCVDQYVELVCEFIKKLELDNVILLGHSFGSRVIIKMMSLEEKPCKVDRIIIVDGAGIKPAPTTRGKIRGRIFKAGKWFYQLKFVQWLDPEGLDDWRQKFGSADYNSATPTMRNTLVKVVNEDLTHLLPNVTPETLLVWGEDDTATPLNDAKIMEKMMPDAGLVVIRGAGHYSFVEQQYTFNQIMISYLGL